MCTKFKDNVALTISNIPTCVYEIITICARVALVLSMVTVLEHALRNNSVQYESLKYATIVTCTWIFLGQNSSSTFMIGGNHRCSITIAPPPPTHTHKTLTDASGI